VTVPPAGVVTAFKVADCPEHIVGLLIVMVGTGATVVEMFAVLVHPWALVTVTVNVPAVVIAALAFDPSPLSHEYVAPPLAVTLIVGALQSMMVVPVLFVMVATGVAFTVTWVDALTEPQLEFMVTLYVPDAAAVAFAMVGFCWFEVNPLGPVQL